jgi:putative ABC transport system substrate-binding protein
LFIDAFREGLRDFGWVEGHNIVIEYQSARTPAQLPALAEILVHQNVDVIFAPTFPAALAARNATQTVPIVAAGHADFVQAGLATTLARPGGNLTGLTTSGVELSAKRIELLNETVPGISCVAVLRHPANPVAEFAWTSTIPAAKRLALRLEALDVQSPADFIDAFETIPKVGATALLVLPDNMIFSNLGRIAELSLKHRIPAMFEQREFVDGGGLISYGANSPAIYRQAAHYVNQIIRGARSAELPVQRPTEFELVVNLRTARIFGLRVPTSILLRADEVIE